MSNTVKRAIKDANEAVASVAYKLSEIIAIYPITPSSPMAEWCDQWSTERRQNLWGTIPEVVQLQSEGGVAGTVHGTLQGGVLTTTFTASQGLLLMIPNLYKIAGELTPFCMHVTARALATHALSIFGDHSDVMAVRQAGFALLSSHSVQSAQDLAAIAHASTLEARIPFLHFFDGFRTSHEINTYHPLDEGTLRALVDEKYILAFRHRGLSPDAPVIRGTAQNPDVYFQCREASNRFYQAVPEIVEKKIQLFGQLTGRHYRLFDYMGHPEAERIFVIMGSGSETVHPTVQYLMEQGEKVGVLRVHLFRPFSIKHFLQAIPRSVKEVIVLDRTKEPGAVAEPLCQDVQSAFQEGVRLGQCILPRILGGRYGLGSKEFNPSMVKSIFDAAVQQTLQPSFTVGIEDDVTCLSVPVKEPIELESADTFRAVFYGLGSDGTVGANKNTVKIIGSETERYVQAYFVYDSKKSGAMTISHLRFGSKPIQAPYLIQTAQFVACHQFQFIEHYDILESLQQKGTLLINAPFAADQVWSKLPQEVQQTLVNKNIQVYAIDAFKVAREAGMGGRINTIMQTCFFAISGILPKEEAIQCIKNAIRKTYGKKGESAVQNNYAAVDAALSNLHFIVHQEVQEKARKRIPLNLNGASEFVQKLTQRLLEQKGDSLPVSLFPADGTWPTGTTQWEKRNIAQELPAWDSNVCIQCNRCSLICPHAAIRSKHYDKTCLEKALSEFKSVDFRSKEYLNEAFTIQIYPEDCTACGLCVEVCPAKNKTDPNRKALNMIAKNEIFEREKENSQFFDTLPWPDTTRCKLDLKTTQFKQPLFEFSGACAGCGETPYIKLISQLLGDRLLIANATGCSSIYGGNLPTTPYTKDANGRGPAWANSLFEDNAEFGLGLRLSSDKKTQIAKDLLCSLHSEVGENLVEQVLKVDPNDAMQVLEQRKCIEMLNERLQTLTTPSAKLLLSLIDFLVEKSVWIVGGDGWAYDIGFGGLDHVLASGRNVNILVLDTEVYSNTGGQQSKATPLGAVAKFATAGKEGAKKDLGLLVMSYGHVYVAQIAIGANPGQAINAIIEANSYPGPSLIIAYSHCIEHGYDLKYGAEQQRLAVESGYWPLYRFDPRRTLQNENPMQLDAVEAKIPLAEYLQRENRFKVLEKLNPERASSLRENAQTIVHSRLAYYHYLAKK
ncbi:MAG: pyruvate:ferredoxin (flavodoxin) oxidoreductase [Puniceicoccales bacterium]|jgi:pyruvate-ferredoxin/flavodoxin oxidoreductase|nr:pyruvate:ferredoxin (flavodoxin) oxidoreductase [Puniceicoccales bacterium]